MLKDSITLYCVRYDPYHCAIDPERLWAIIQRSGGHISTKPMGIIDFYVPARVITQVALMDSGLSVRTKDSYI